MPLVDTMTAYGLAANDTSGVLHCIPVERRKPQAGDVHIAIKYCGICHSDFSEIRGEWPKPHLYPMVPGHEIVGEVLDVGSGVTKYKKGDRVGVGCMVDSCRKCDSCQRGLEQYCSGGNLFTYNSLISDENKIRVKNHPKGEVTQGGYSTHVTVREEFVCKVPDKIPLEKAGPLLCAGITMYSPLVRFGAKKAGKDFKVAIAGFGGLGHMAVKLSHAMGNDVTVISRGTKKQAAALAAGAHHYVDSKDAKSMKAASGKFDLILNTIGVNHDIVPYMNLVRTDGTMCMLGVPPGKLQLHAFNVIGGRKSLAGSLIGGLPETQEMLEFCAEHKIVPDTELIPASFVNKAIYNLGHGHNDASRYVIDMSTLKEGLKVDEESRIDPKTWMVNLPEIVFPKEALHSAHRAQLKQS